MTQLPHPLGSAGRVLACWLSFCSLAVMSAQEHTNIVVLFSDDAGWADFGFQEHHAADVAELTPHIDSIAQAGVRFRSAYVSGAVCSPSRAGLLTGRYQQRFGHERNLPQGYMKGGLDLNERTIADRLGAAGFATGLVGKWHLGYPEEYQPNRRGFDLFEGLLQGSRSYHPLAKPGPHRVLQQNGTALPEVGYVTDRFGDAAERFIDEHAAEPFFLLVSFTATHGPLEPLESDLAKLSTEIQERRRKNLGLLVGLDRAVGRVLAKLEERGLSDQTMVVFTNDNGGQTLTGANNGPLRGAKGQLWEGGVRVPMAIRWPAQIAAGRTIDAPVSLLDLMPTFLALAGAEVDPSWQLDGQDLGPLLRDASHVPAERSFYWRTTGSKGPIAVRRGAYKLVHLRGDEAATPALFDLDQDLGEQHDLAAEQPERVEALLTELAAWEAQLIEPLWSY